MRAFARRAQVAVFAGYLAISLLYFGPRVVAHPERTHIGGLFTDPQIFIWSFAWWPHAILNGDNPFYTHAIFAPDGINLTWVTSVPGLAIPLSPLTLAFGPTLSYNVACILMPALAAWAAFLLCRYVTGATWPALVGGYLFGFSSYILGGELSHVNTIAVFPTPLAALLVLRFLRHDLSARALALGLGVLLALQLSFSTEILFTSTLALVCALVLGAVLVPSMREGLRRLLVPLVGAYALAVAIAGPFLYFVLTGLDSRAATGRPVTFVADALNFVVPTQASFGGWWSHDVARHFPANDTERGAYLGLPTLVIVGWLAWRRRGSPAVRFLLASFIIALIASLGSWLTVDGRRVVSLPWVHIAHLPLIDRVMAVRLAMYGTLAAVVMVAMFAASSVRPAWLRVLLPGLAVIAVLPNFSLGAWARSPNVPALFTSGEYRDCLGRGGNVLAVPIGPAGDSMVWQADAGFWFRIAGGYIAPRPPASFLEPPSIVHLTTGDNPREITTAAVLELARLKSIRAVVVDVKQSAGWRRILAPLGPPQHVAGALIYRVGTGPTYPGCGGRALK